MKALLRVVMLCAVTAAPSLAQAPPPPAQETEPVDYETIRFEKDAVAVRTSGEIILDGLLDEPGWKLAIPATDFIQRQPFPGEPSPERSEVYFLYDDENLYVGWINFDSQADQIRVNDLREDFAFRGTDSIGIVIDSLHDLRSGFLFGTSPAGAKRDSQISNDSSFNDDWDGNWDVKVTRNGDGWIAEFAIPFATLRFSGSPTQEWGLNLNRRIMRLNEESMWTPLPVRYSVNRMSLAGTLSGLENIRQGRNLTVTPYVTAGFTESGANMSPREIDNDRDVGVDLKYGLTPSLTLDATYNTDFAQVEVDQQQVNLSRFGLFFPEKRDFFLENSGTFGFGSGNGRSAGPLVPFFSRRIGLSDEGTPIRILGGARVSGKIGRYDVGVLAMKTDEQVGQTGTTPSNNYFVGRIKRNLLANSWVGALTTHRDSTIDGDTNRVYGADARFQFFDRLTFDTYILASDTPDRRGGNQARQFATTWRDDELQVSAQYLSIQPDFNPEVGFVRRRDMTQYSGDFAWNPRVNGESIRNYRFETGLVYTRAASTGELETREHQITTGIQFQNNSSITFLTRETFDRLTAPFNIRPTITIPVGDYKYREYSASASTDTSRMISGSGSLDWGNSGMATGLRLAAA